MKRLSFIIVFLLFIATSCSKAIVQEHYTFYAMDTVITITFYDTEQSKELAKNVESIYKKYENVADDYHRGNGICTVYDLNEKREAEISFELKELLEFSIEMQKDTDGFFNPCIGRLSHLWKQALEDKKLPKDAIIASELSIMNETDILIEGLHAKLIGEGNIDLGGVAKGFATSKAKEYLDSLDCHSYLLNAGASAIVLGNKKGKDFVVGLSKSFDSGYYKILHLKEKVIATSSIKEQYVKIEDTLYSHLLNPKTGYPAMLYDSISIIGEDSKTLDAYSTACFAMELEELKTFLKNKNLEFVVAKQDKLLFQSEGVEDYA